MKYVKSAVFSRDVLARSSLTGGRSNANGADISVRPALDQVRLHEMIGKFACTLKLLGSHQERAVSQKYSLPVCRRSRHATNDFSLAFLVRA